MSKVSLSDFDRRTPISAHKGDLEMVVEVSGVSRRRRDRVLRRKCGAESLVSVPARSGNDRMTRGRIFAPACGHRAWRRDGVGLRHSNGGVGVAAL